MLKEIKLDYIIRNEYLMKNDMVNMLIQERP